MTQYASQPAMPFPGENAHTIRLNVASIERHHRAIGPQAAALLVALAQRGRDVYCYTAALSARVNVWIEGTRYDADELATLISLGTVEDGRPYLVPPGGLRATLDQYADDMLMPAGVDGWLVMVHCGVQPDEREVLFAPFAGFCEVRGQTLCLLSDARSTMLTLDEIRYHAATTVGGTRRVVTVAEARRVACALWRHARREGDEGV